MNETFWAIRRRERANREAKAAKASVKKVEEPVEDPVEVDEEPSYRDLQAQAKELDIPANQSADDLKAAIDEAEIE
jgi:ribosome-associated translation inhibitor RaiA